MKLPDSIEKKYSYKLEDIQSLIAKDLNVRKEKVDVRYIIEEVGGDFEDRWPGRNEVTRIEVFVKE